MPGVVLQDDEIGSMFLRHADDVSGWSPDHDLALNVDPTLLHEAATQLEQSSTALLRESLVERAQLSVLDVANALDDVKQEDDAVVRSSQVQRCSKAHAGRRGQIRRDENPSKHGCLQVAGYAGLVPVPTSLHGGTLVAYRFRQSLAPTPVDLFRESSRSRGGALGGRMRSPLLKPSIGAVLFAVCTIGNDASAQDARAPRRAPWRSRQPSKRTHLQLRDDLARALADKGAVGDAARAIERVLTLHLKHDEEVVLLPLGLVRPLVEDEAVSDPARVLAVVAQIERELPQLLQEHRAILDAVRRLKDAAGRERKPEFLGLAERLWVHAVMEDQVLYYTSILVGRHLQLKEGTKTKAR